MSTRAWIAPRPAKINKASTNNIVDQASHIVAPTTQKRSFLAPPPTTNLTKRTTNLYKYFRIALEGEARCWFGEANIDTPTHLRHRCLGKRCCGDGHGVDKQKHPITEVAKAIAEVPTSTTVLERQHTTLPPQLTRVRYWDIVSLACLVVVQTDSSLPIPLSSYV